MPIALSNLDASSWLCFVLGGIVLLVGVMDGLLIAPAKAAKDKKELEKTKAANEALAAGLEATRSKILKGEDAADVQALTETAETAKTAAEQISSIVASLPEYQRFSGMMVLLGAALMGVATIQFGGTSIF